MRPCKREDGRFLINWLTEERQMHMWCGDHFIFPLTEEQMNGYYKEMEEDERSWGFTVLDQSGTPAGSFKMTRADYDAESIHLGFIVIDPKRRGQGLGREMVSMAVNYGVRLLGMKRITLKVFENNPGARRCYEKAGFAVESCNEKGFLYHDEMWSVFLMSYEE